MWFLFENISLSWGSLMMADTGLLIYVVLFMRIGKKGTKREGGKNGDRCM
jgi:hypothetical protein